MLAYLLPRLGAVHAMTMALIILSDYFDILGEKTQQYFLAKRYRGEDRISALPDDLLVRILSLVPTKDVVATMVLSKRWRSIWTKVPYLVYHDNKYDTRGIVIAGLLGRLLDRLTGKTKPRCIWGLLDESLRLHKAKVLDGLVIQLGQHCPIDVDVVKWIADAVDHRKLRYLWFMLSWSTAPTKLPKSLYTCDTLVTLALCDKVLVDVPSNLACLPSLKYLGLHFVVYKDEDSLVTLLSGCPTLKYMAVQRYHKDNVIYFNINVPTLEGLFYRYDDDRYNIGGTLVINSKALKMISITDFSGESCLIENKPCLDKATINVIRQPDNTFMRSLASLIYIEIFLNNAMVACCEAISFSKLKECKITLVHELDWLEPFMLLLQNSPNLKIVFVDQAKLELEENFALSWNQPDSVPGCVSGHLEIFEWKGYGGRSKEKEVVRYIFANSKCLKRAGISMKTSLTWKWSKKRMRKELESMYRISPSSQLLFSTQLDSFNVLNEMIVY